MAFLDKLGNLVKDIGEKAGEVVVTTKQKANEAIESGKIHTKIRTEQDNLDGVYHKIGEYIVAQYTGNDAVTPELKELVGEANKSQEAIAQYEQELVKLREEAEKKPEKPETEEADQPAETTAEAPEAQPVQIQCPRCGTMNDASNTFCYKCGALLHEPPAQSAPTEAQAEAAMESGAQPDTEQKIGGENTASPAETEVAQESGEYNGDTTQP